MEIFTEIFLRELIACAELHVSDLCSSRRRTMETENEDEQVQKDCVQLFSSTDFIMEPKVFDTIKE